MAHNHHILDGLSYEQLKEIDKKADKRRIRKWILKHPAQSLSLAAGAGFLIPALVDKALLIWLLFVVLFTSYFVYSAHHAPAAPGHWVGKPQPRPGHTGHTGPLPPLP